MSAMSVIIFRSHPRGVWAVEITARARAAAGGAREGMANRPTDAQRLANQAAQLHDWSSQLRAVDSTVQQLDLLRRLVADDGSSDAVEWLLEQVNGHSDSPPDKAPSAAPTEEEILAELPPSHLDHLLTEEERCLFERDGVRICLCHALYTPAFCVY
eukprot:COSAG06_NODE_3273_length_5579_cov_3.094708_4_plen_157_part_00